MLRTAPRWLLGTILGLVVYGFVNDRPAQALTIVSSPFGSDPVDVRIGSCTTAPCQVVVWFSYVRHACQFTIIGNGSGLIDDVQVHAGSAGDVMYIVQGQAQCPEWTVGPLLYNGHYLDMYGDGGDDFIDNTSQHGDTQVHGGDGNDTILSIGSIFGENGNDKMRAEGTPSDEVLLGGAGNDCIKDDSGTAATIDCGPGTDKIARLSSGVTPASVSCEAISTTNCI